MALMPHVRRMIDDNALPPAAITAEWYRLPLASNEAQMVQQVAEQLFEDSETIGIRGILETIGTAIGTKLSALREAIQLCAERCVSGSQEVTA